MSLEFTDLHREYYPRVRRFILARVGDLWLADDLSQETFIRVQAKLHTLRDPGKTQAWIFSIAVNLCADHFHARKKDPAQAGDDEQRDLPAALMPVDQLLELDEMCMCVRDKLARLPDNLREVLTLRDLMEFSYQEIADILGISLANTKVRIHRARKQMKEVLKEHCNLERDGRDVLVCTPKEPLAAPGG